MSDNFIGAGLPTIRLDTDLDLSSATVKRILYEKPDGTTGYWTATADDTYLTYNLANGDIDQRGQWKFQTYIEVSGEKAYGRITRIDFKSPLV